MIAEIESDERENIETAADACAASMLQGGVVHVYDTGHMLNSELVSRAGGLVGLTPLSFGMNVGNPNSFREKTAEPKNLTADTVALALRQSNLRSGDVLFVGSVSGKSERVVELAVQARAMGVKVVAITSLAYSSQLQSEHPSGKRLYEVANIVLDNHAPYGDAMLSVEGLDAGICPASGIAAACIMWAVVAGTVERLLAGGVVPTVYKSVNAPGGPADVQARQERYKEVGY